MRTFYNNISVVATHIVRFSQLFLVDDYWRKNARQLRELGQTEGAPYLAQEISFDFSRDF